MQIGNNPRSSPLMAVFFNQFRLGVVIFVTCSVYLLLHSNFGGFGGFSSYVQVEEFPKKIWQSWKVDALRFEDRDTERAMSWTTKNPAHRYEVLTDDSAMTYVEQFYGPAGFNRPDIVYTYRSLNSIRIIQSDLLRYLIMYAEGGVWADIDVEAVRSISHFIPKRFNEKDINMVIGIETDEPDFKGTRPSRQKRAEGPALTYCCRSSSTWLQGPILLPMDLHVQTTLACHDATYQQHSRLAEQTFSATRSAHLRAPA
jgi:hypothetical protein